MARNLESKFADVDLNVLRQRCQAMGATCERRKHQIDTYFRVLQGRLKLRQEAGCATLIAYARPDQASARWSHYCLCPISDPETFLQTMQIAPGVQVVVRKTRELWLQSGTRIHLDEVEDLGQFAELETVLRQQSMEEAALEHQRILDRLGLIDHPHCSGSYSDLLMRQDIP